jgi:hypothetical protein
MAVVLVKLVSQLKAMGIVIFETVSEDHARPIDTLRTIS